MNSLFNPRPRSEYIAPHTTTAAQFVEAIKTIAAKPDNLDNLTRKTSFLNFVTLQKWRFNNGHFLDGLRRYCFFLGNAVYLS